MAYQPIEDCGVIGDLHTVALVGRNGSIDWMCYPHFDSPSIFGAILDAEKGGRHDVEQSPDGLEGEEGTFSMCTFWQVEALTRAGRLPEARLIFERMLGYSNHLGLYAEHVGASGEAIGSFPQAFTHLGLISAAFNLDRALGGSR